MPVYNGARFLREAIESILSQTYTDFELLLINDGSTDNSEKIIQQYTDDRILYLKHEQNQGLIASLNTGLLHATGSYIARMDADDVALPNRFAEQLSAFGKQNDLVAVGSDYYLLSGTEQVRHSNDPDSDYIKACLLFAPYFNHPTMMIKNVFASKGITYNKAFIHAEDYRLWTELAFEGTFFIVNKPLLKYRSHAAQISSQHRSTQHEISGRIRKEYLERLGFRCSDEQLRVHNSIGNNEFIRSSALLSAIDAWLQELIAQNNTLKLFNAASFNRAIHKFWLDSCGHSRLGIKAFKAYFRSPLSQLGSLSQQNKWKLLAKCLLRMFRSR